MAEHLFSESPKVFFAARDIGKEFRIGRQHLSVLRSVNLEIAEGDFLAIRGSSGAGKSTLLHILGLLDHPSRGELIYRDQELSQARESLRTVIRATEFAFVFQFYYLLPEFSALENVAMPALIAGRRLQRRGLETTPLARRQRAQDLLVRVGLKERLNHRPHQLSGGERQRVAIARALMNSPRIVFCDEPTGNLDSRTAEGIHELLRDLNARERQTLVVVTHEEAMAAVARRQLEMRDGAIVEDCAPEEATLDIGVP